MVNANHETNLLAVANKQVDAATNNTENLRRIQKTYPDKHGQIRILWKSPLIPSDPIVWRKDLPAEVKGKIKAFFMDYGRKGDNLKQERKVLADLQWAPFKSSSNKQLLPVRQLVLFRNKLKLEADTRMAADEKRKKLADIDRKLQRIQAEAGTN